MMWGKQPRKLVTSTLTLLLLATSAGCTFSHLDFVQDRRVSILTPHNRATVQLPVTVRWSVRDFDITGPGAGDTGAAGYFLLLIDTTPQPPGHPLRWLAHGDRLCLATPGCPDAAWLARHQIFTTTKTSFTIRTLAPRMSSDLGGPNRHQVTIVLLDPSGHRIGETAFTVTFQLRSGEST